MLGLSGFSNFLFTQLSLMLVLTFKIEVAKAL